MPSTTAPPFFEGIRGNWNAEHETTYIFRLREHYERLHLGCRILMLDIPYSVDDLCNITVELVQKNGNRSDVYIRPLAYKSEELVANLKLHEIASDFTLIVVPFGNYLGTENLRCCTSSWRRLEDQMTPTQIKTSANYLNSILAKTESVLAGFDEAILLNQDGHVAEGSGENLFMMRKGKLITPILEDNPLPGITRETVMELAQEELGIEVVERRIDRTELYLADEVFLSGTAAHLTPVISLDSRPIADGNPGPVSTAPEADVLRHRVRAQPQVPALVHRRRPEPSCGLKLFPALGQGLDWGRCQPCWGAVQVRKGDWRGIMHRGREAQWELSAKNCWITSATTRIIAA